MNSVRVLLVEDDLVDKMHIARLLEELNFDFTLTELSTSEAATEYLTITEKPPTHIIIDNYLPGRVGIDFIKYVRGLVDLRDIKIALVTGLSNKELINEAYNNEVDFCWEKPISNNDLVKFFQKY